MKNHEVTAKHMEYAVAFCTGVTVTISGSFGSVFLEAAKHPLNTTENIKAVAQFIANLQGVATSKAIDDAIAYIDNNYNAMGEWDCVAFDNLRSFILKGSGVNQNITPEKTPETVKEIVADYLKKNGYDGLCRDGCGCGLDCFMPCSDEIRHNCRPAYAKTQKCSECDSYDSCDFADSSETQKTCYSIVKKD